MKPTKFSIVAPVPTIAPSNLKSTPEITLDNSEPSPLNCSAVTIPDAFTFLGVISPVVI